MEKGFSDARNSRYERHGDVPCCTLVPSSPAGEECLSLRINFVISSVWIFQGGMRNLQRLPGLEMRATEPFTVIAWRCG